MKQVGARASVESSQWGEGPPSFPVSVRVAPARVCARVDRTANRPRARSAEIPVRPLHLRLPVAVPRTRRGAWAYDYEHKRMP